MSDARDRAYSQAELTILEGVIDYADRMIHEERHLDVRGGMADATGVSLPPSTAPLYNQLRRHAYAKTVVIDTARKGRIEIRLSTTEATYPNAASGYCTPHNPIGRLVVTLSPNDEGENKIWGEYTVAEVRSFDRYAGQKFEPNVRNFLQMSFEGDNGKGNVTDLRGFVQAKRSRTRKKIASDTPLAAPPPAPADAPISPGAIFPPRAIVARPPVAPLPSVRITQLSIAEECDALDTGFDIDDAEWSAGEVDNQPEDYFGLNERFLTHQTMEQNQVISRSPFGAMFVQGIAGSGKTSAALGRTKMLTTFNMNQVFDEASFRDVVGDDQAYWAKQYAGQFSQDSCVGFVRTGELIQYLEETCRRIELQHLPILEYKELQTRLRDHRRITHSDIAGRRWSGFAGVRGEHVSTRMVWLHAADQAIGRLIGRRLLDVLPSAEELTEPFEPDARDKVRRVTGIALDELRRELRDIASDLLLPPRGDRFTTDRLASRLTAKVDNVRKRVMGTKVIWTRIDGKILFASDEQALAQQLVELKTALYFRQAQRLVFLGADGLIDKSLELITTAGEPVAWSDNVRTQMSRYQVIVREPSGKCFHAVPSDANHLYLRLLPESSERVLVPVAGELHRLPLARGWGRQKLALRGAEDDQSADGISLENSAQKTMTPESIFMHVVQQRLLQPLANIADTYLAALQEFPDAFPDAELVSSVRLQLEKFRLADADIDTMLCLAHLVGRDFRSGNRRWPQLQEPVFFQAVFVDEVQDFTEQQVFLMVEQANPAYRAVTVAGDLAQKLHHGNSIDLTACFPGQSIPNIQLTENLRQSDRPGIALFSACFRAVMQGGSQPSEKLTSASRLQGDALVMPRFKTCTTDEEVDARILEELSQTQRYQTAAILFSTAAEASRVFKRLENNLKEQLIDAKLSEKVDLARRYIRHFADVANAKGLEFDVVVLVGVDGYDLARVSDINRLYVGVTRARQRLTILNHRKTLAAPWSRVLSLYQACLGVS
ncbi:ATP-binding domain-containing protein [Sphaerotilus montanus]|uniref:ATP-binding domain-containing protein n=1 Tax=Sphaerotilus montanus TaxID=522889 RepID=UPI0015D902B9|nr:ATP-binding domain-containing protein [Sphaerotilus montanus]NZD58551.1 ATP-binding domain-containing protein [Sphaerotilus montanus]